MLIKLRSRYVGSLEEKIRRLEQELQQTQQATGTRQTIEPLLTHPLSDAALVNDFNRQNPPPQPRLSRTQSVQPISSDPTGSSLEKDHDLIKVLKYGKSMMLKRILKADGEVSIHSALADFGVAPSGTSPSETTQVQYSDLQDMNASCRDADADIRAGNFPLDDDNLILPSRVLANRLVDLFFENVAPILPLVHEPSFRQELNAYYDDPRSESIAFRSLVNMVFAYGCDYLQLELSQTYQLSQEFHKRATELILLVCYELASLEVVQALLLVTLHLNSTLSIEAGHSVPPATVDDSQILPTCIAEPTSIPHQPSQMHFFNCLMQLIQISEMALSSKSNGPRNDIYSQMSLALDQESKVAQWLERLPEHLRFNYNNTDTKLRRQQRSLQTRYLHTRLMIHRMNMLSAVSSDKRRDPSQLNDKFLQSVLAASVQQCIDCSCELISLVNDYYQQNILGPWWLLLQFIFTTLATLFALRARSHLVKYQDDGRICSSIEKAMALLQSFGDINPTLTQCRRYFESMMPPKSKQTAKSSTQESLSFQQQHNGSRPLPPSYGDLRVAAQAVHTRPTSSVHSSMDFHPAHDINFFAADETMSDYSAELLADSTFGTFNFGALDPVLQM
ncbi:hypothetical protein H2204_003532 [Knufia peltigerae]|uniref:Xylanolytic transcriptional activator regulatory domain-containing protein n=1 Tax=Knufia peltigerae TaxID=1002370 RepID=A0AA38YAF8_9EURO|nr:hypothetical protein H2204_003532 [Knufia peltigerae]